MKRVATALLALLVLVPWLRAEYALVQEQGFEALCKDFESDILRLPELVKQVYRFVRARNAEIEMTQGILVCYDLKPEAGAQSRVTIGMQVAGRVKVTEDYYLKLFTATQGVQIDYEGEVGSFFAFYLLVLTDVQKQGYLLAGVPRIFFDIERLMTDKILSGRVFVPVAPKRNP